LKKGNSQIRRSSPSSRERVVWLRRRVQWLGEKFHQLE
jgi:hypothetical protein